MIDCMLVTGASKGIGAAIIRKQLAMEDGARTIVAVARKSDAYEKLAAEMREKHPKKRLVQMYADVSNFEDVIRITDEVAKQGLGIGALINNAGYTNPKSINETTADDFLHTLKTNLIAPFLLVKHLIKQQQPLKIVLNIASTAGINGRPGWLSYSASKAALINMSEVMRQELKPYGCRVVCLSPGRCATDLRRVLAPDEDPKTIMQPEQVADIVALMCSESGMLIESQNLVVRT